MNELVTTRIRSHAGRLGLTHLGEVVDQPAARAESERMGYLDFLDLLLEEELGLRESRRFRNALKLSGLPHHQTLEEFDFAFQPDLDAGKVRDLATLSFVEAKSNIGPAGTARRRQDHARRRPVRGRLPGRLLHLLHHARRPDPPAARRRGHRPVRRQLTAFLRPALLVVDEVGYLPLDRAEANMVFQLVSRRYERGSMIITSNKSFTEWGQVLGDDVLATAILDRLLHHCDVLSINGPSYRLKDRLNLVTGGEPMS